MPFALWAWVHPAELFAELGEPTENRTLIASLGNWCLVHLDDRLKIFSVLPLPDLFTVKTNQCSAQLINCWTSEGNQGGNAEHCHVVLRPLNLEANQRLAL